MGEPWVSVWSPSPWAGSRDNFMDLQTSNYYCIYWNQWYVIRFNTPLPWDSIDAIYLWHRQDSDSNYNGVKSYAYATDGTLLWTDSFPSSGNQGKPLEYMRAALKQPPPPASVGRPPPVAKNLGTPCARPLLPGPGLTALG